MSLKFQRRHAFTARWEGGYVDHPKDPGGATNFGITQKTYDGWRDVQGLGRRPVKHISDQEVLKIYQTNYWDEVRGDDLPEAIAGALYDFAVNSGPKRAILRLQKAIRKVSGAPYVDTDGVIGPQTIGAVQEVAKAGHLRILLRMYLSNRVVFLAGLPTWDYFGNGWSRRVMDLGLECGELLNAQ